MFSVQGLLEPCVMDVLIELLSHWDEDWRVELILDNLTFNFNSLLGIVYVSFSIQFPTVKECDFDRQFLFDEYVAISHCYIRSKKVIIEKLNDCSFVLCKNWIVYDARQPVEFP
jgi:hypothetical protein